jgi:heptosyltransferase-1
MSPRETPAMSGALFIGFCYHRVRLEASYTRILIVKASSLGDIIMALPMLRTLRHAYPQAYIAWLVESPFQDFLHGNKDLDRLFVVDTTGVRSVVVGLYHTIRQIRAEAFDVVVDLQGWIKSQLVCKLSGAQSMVGVMKNNELGFHILSRGVPFRPKAHMVDLFLEVAALLGAAEPQVSFFVPIFDADEKYIDSFLGALALKHKRWSLRKLADVGRHLAMNGDFIPVVTWGPDEESDALHVVSLIGNGAVLAPRTTIRQLAALIKRSALYVGTDSGPMHLASALGVPTVGLFGPSDPAHFAPYQPAGRVVRRELACSPCGLPTCRFKTMECMESIDVPDVLEAIRLVAR